MHSHIAVQHILGFVSVPSIAKNSQITPSWEFILTCLLCVLVLCAQSKIWCECTRECKRANISDALSQHQFFCIFGNTSDWDESNDGLIFRNGWLLKEKRLRLILKINIISKYWSDFIQIVIFFQIMLNCILMDIWMHIWCENSDIDWSWCPSSADFTIILMLKYDMPTKL